MADADHDPLGVRAATSWVLAQAEDVAVDARRAAVVADRIAADAMPRPVWRTAPLWWNDADRAATATYVLVLDALNFSFWGEPKWRVRWRGQTLDGYWALAASLTSAVERGVPLTDPLYLADAADAGELLAGADGTTIPLLAARQAALQEAGRGARDACGGSFLACVSEARGSATRLLRSLVEHFPSFRDVAHYQGREVPFYKRAQLLAADLAGALLHEPGGLFGDLSALTMFADYKVPQVLHGLGVLRYSSALEATVRRHTAMAYGEPREVEIRAASVQAVELICRLLAERGLEVPAFDVDWRLWWLGQGRAWPLPYHRTRSVFY